MNVLRTDLINTDLMRHTQDYILYIYKKLYSEMCLIRRYYNSIGET